MYLQHHNLLHLSFLTVSCLLSSIFVYSETKYKYSKLKQSLNTSGVQIYVPYFSSPKFFNYCIFWAVGEKYIHNLFAKIRTKSYEVSILQEKVSHYFFTFNIFENWITFQMNCVIALITHKLLLCYLSCNCFHKHVIVWKWMQQTKVGSVLILHKQLYTFRLIFVKTFA